MNAVSLELTNDCGCYLPGQTVEAQIAWELDAVPKSIEARLFWYTRGKGTTDTMTVAAESYVGPVAAGRWRVVLAIPADAVCSYSGRLISVRWAVEVVAEKKLGFARQELVVSTTGAVIVAPDAT